MKKVLLSLLAIMMVTISFAQQRTIEDVKQIVSLHKSGEKWQGRKLYLSPKMLAPADGNLIRSSEILELHSILKPNEEAFYVYSEGSGNSGLFIIVSGDERMEAVLGYSDHSAFPSGELPCNVKYWLNEYVKEYSQISSTPNKTKIKRTSPKRAAANSVDPIVKTTWDQGSPYNKLCPTLSNGIKTVTGCVATAMAQAISVYEYPDYAVGSVDYSTDTYGIPLSANLANYPFNWNNIKKDYSNGYTSAEANAVANLMYACGLSVEMDYGPESAASSSDAMNALAENFGYDNDMIIASKDAMQIEQWHSLLTDNLNNGMPIVYSGGNENNEGHCFIIDGYTYSDQEPFYHVNWGWSGLCDGYYKMANLSPTAQGIGGNNGNFNRRNAAILGVKPDNNIVENRGFLQADKIEISPDIIPVGTTSASLKLYSVFNYGRKSFTGKINAYLVNGNNRTFVGSHTINNLEFYRGWNNLSISLSLPSSLSTGNYIIEVCTKCDGFDEQPLYSGNGNPTLTIGTAEGTYDPQIMVTDMVTTITGERAVSVEGYKILNYAERSFSGQIKLAIADKNDNIVTVFGTAFNVDDLPNLYSYTYPQTISGTIPSNITDGEYNLWMVAQQSGYSNWAKVTKYTVSSNYITEIGKPCFTPIVITNGVVAISEENLPEFYANLQTTAFDITSSNTQTRSIEASVSQICNFGNEVFNGDVSLVVTDVNGGNIIPFGTPTTISSSLGHYSYLTNPRTLSGVIPANLPNGAYKIQLAAKQNGCRGWSILKKYAISDGYIVDKDKECSYPFWIVGGEMTFDEPFIPVTSISLDRTSATLNVGNEIQLIAKILPEDASNKTVNWTSSATNIAKVDANGKVKALAIGNAVITAKTTDGTNLTATCNITVAPILAQSITLNKTTISGNVGDTSQLTATVLPANTTDKTVQWQTSDASIATVSNSGLVTLKAIGNAVITAKTTDGSNLTATCNITVVPILAQSITLNHTTINGNVGDTSQLTATVLPANTTDKTVQWQTSDASIATVSNSGLVTLKAKGNAVITVKTTDGSNLTATCNITVAPILAQSITLDKTEISVTIGETAQLTATVLPSDTDNKNVQWKTSDESIATVSNTGLVTITGVGEAIITAKTTDGSNLSATCKVTGLPILVQTISLDQTTVNMHVNETVTLNAIISPTNATTKDVVWSSSNYNVAKVDNNGQVKALSLGSTVITVRTTDGSNISATCTINVLPILAENIILSETSLTLNKDDKVQLIATVLPENTTNKNVKWYSDNENAATVSDSGLVTCTGDGIAYISATTMDGSDISATCILNCIDGISYLYSTENILRMTTVDGKVIEKLTKGINIIYYTDGTVQKIFVK